MKKLKKLITLFAALTVMGSFSCLAMEGENKINEIDLKNINLKNDDKLKEQAEKLIKDALKLRNKLSKLYLHAVLCFYPKQYNLISDDPFDKNITNEIIKKFTSKDKEDKNQYRFVNTLIEWNNAIVSKVPNEIVEKIGQAWFLIQYIKDQKIKEILKSKWDDCRSSIFSIWQFVQKNQSYVSRNLVFHTALYSFLRILYSEVEYCMEKMPKGSVDDKYIPEFKEIRNQYKEYKDVLKKVKEIAKRKYELDPADLGNLRNSIWTHDFWREPSTFKPNDQDIKRDIINIFEKNCEGNVSTFLDYIKKQYDAARKFIDILYSVDKDDEDVKTFETVGSYIGQLDWGLKELKNQKFEVK